MNKLRTNVFMKKPWGAEIIWSLTDSYMAKTVDISPNNSTPLMTHQTKEISLIVTRGPLHLLYDIPTKAYDLPEGWSWHINAGTPYRYEALDKPVTLIEVSTPQLDDLISVEVPKLPTENEVKRKRRSKKNGTS